MNLGTLCGFTLFRGLAPGQTYPEMKVKYVDESAYTVLASDINTLLMFRYAGAIAVTLPDFAGWSDGSATHFVALGGGGQVTVSPEGDVVLRNASSNKTRTVYSVITAMKMDTKLYLIFGDME